MTISYILELVAKINLMELTINIIHPTEGKMINVVVDNSITPNEILAELRAVEFISRKGSYSLGIKGGSLLQDDNPLFNSDLKEGDTIRILPNVNAG